MREATLTQGEHDSVQKVLVPLCIIHYSASSEYSNSTVMYGTCVKSSQVDQHLIASLCCYSTSAVDSYRPLFGGTVPYSLFFICAFIFGKLSLCHCAFL